MFKSILVVCSGNICRSPIGEALLRKALNGSVTVESAGVTALVGHPADEMAQEVMTEHGHDISAHRAQQVTGELIARHDLILTMDSFHDDSLHSRYPQLRGRVYRIRHWCEEKTVEDPYRLPKAAFEASYREIAEGVANWLLKLR